MLHLLVNTIRFQHLNLSWCLLGMGCIFMHNTSSVLSLHHAYYEINVALIPLLVLLICRLIWLLMMMVLLIDLIVTTLVIMVMMIVLVKERHKLIR